MGRTTVSRASFFFFFLFFLHDMRQMFQPSGLLQWEYIFTLLKSSTMMFQKGTPRINVVKMCAHISAMSFSSTPALIRERHTATNSGIYWSVLYWPCVYDSSGPDFNDYVSVKGLRGLGLVVSGEVKAHRHVTGDHGLALICMYHRDNGQRHAQIFTCGGEQN